MSRFSTRTARRWTGAGLVAGLLATFCTVVLGATPAGADSSAVVDRPATSATVDALPTAQINGVVWQQAINGDTVYAGGDFTTARPAGSAAGVNTVPRTYALTYSLSTGLLGSFAPSLNAPVRGVAVSPDGSRVYFGGSFTSADGQKRYRIAAYSTATGTLISTFVPLVSGQVDTIVATNTTVYLGGVFTSVNGVARNKIAAVNAADGSTTAWNPGADAEVMTMVLSPDGSRLIIGGRFKNAGGAANFGLASIDAVSGSSLAFAANQVVQDAGPNAAIYSLRTDGSAIYGTAYSYHGGGTLEGTFKADPTTGNLLWVESCHGDTYDSFPSPNGVVYTVSHAHNCADVGGFGQTDTPWVTHRANAFTTATTGTLAHNYDGGIYKDWGGYPSPSLVAWSPDLTIGTYTGQGQAAWTITGNSQYVAMAGEFLTVNGTAQQGIVRFAVNSLAPKAERPRLSGNQFVPNLVSTAPGSVRVAWQANWDRDDRTLTYNVVRNGAGNKPVWTGTANSMSWDRPMMGFTDTGLTPGATYTYSIRATDSTGNTVVGTAASITLPTSGPSSTVYAQRAVTDGASPLWTLGESSGSVAYDTSRFNDGTVTGGVTRGVAGPIAGTTASTFDGSTGNVYQQATSAFGPTTFTMEAWFQTTTTQGGEIMGYGTAATGLSQNNDRLFYMTNTGQVYYGVGNNEATVKSTAAYNDGLWHHVVATQSSSGATLYIDGTAIASNTVNALTPFSLRPGYWRVGGDSLLGYNSAPTSNYFAGNIALVAVYPTVLSPAQISAHYAAASSTSVPPTAKISYSCSTATCSFDGSGSSAASGTITSYLWNFGDGTTSTAATPQHPYYAAGNYRVTLTVTDSSGNQGTSVTTVPVASASTDVAPTASFTATMTDLSGHFDASASSDPDGSIASYAWDFGDGTTGTGAIVDHAYATANTYTVTLTVTDNQGATGTSTQTVTARTPNVAPTASFTASMNALAGHFDASASSDPDGSIASYAWDFGDGTTGTGAIIDHTYAAANTYTVTLTVTDNQGAIGTSSQTVTASTAVNQAPTAAFTIATSGLTASVDGRSSSDPDGTVTTWAWQFGDGATAVGSMASHVYSTPGVYPITLTVTDNQGATSTITKSVAVSSAQIYASDTFARTVASGWGSADTGGAWTATGGAANLSVTPGKASAVAPAAGSGPGAFLNATSIGDSVYQVDVSRDKVATAGGDYVFLVGRRSGSSDYRLRLKFLASGQVQMSLVKVVGSSTTVLSTVTVPGVTYTPGLILRLKLQITGSSTVSLSGKAWAASGTEPAAWQTTASDASSPIATGVPGLLTLLSAGATNAPLTTSWSNYLVTAVP